MSEPKFCKDCKHFNEAGAVTAFGASFSWPERCNQPPERDLIYGRKIPASPHLMRDGKGACGIEARLWEEKLPEDATKKSIDGMIRSQDPCEFNQPIGTWIEQQISPQAKAWWEFWK